jgi:hypothetical protein
MPILDPNQPYTFSRYFELRIDPIDLVDYFGYGLQRTPLVLQQYQGDLDDELRHLNHSIRSILPRLVSMNEQAKREMLIAPVVRAVVERADALLRIEYTITVSPQLQGTLDYLISLDNLSQLLVIEAKRDDLDYGFTQLAAELIALDQWERSPTVTAQPLLIGAISTGQIWTFGVLDRQSRLIQQGLDSYRIPEDLESVLRILLQQATSPAVNQDASV